MRLDEVFHQRLESEQYRLIEQVGAGGMGQIYLAQDQQLGRTVVLKRLQSHASTVSASILAEARLQATINHPNVAQVYQVLNLAEEDLIVMEYIDGVTLDRYFQQTAQTPRHKLEILLQLAEGVAAAHAMSIVHRDLKPANVLVDASARVKLIDFGIAHLTQEFVSAKSDFASRSYASPEQLSGGETGFPSDWYSFAVIAIECLTGRHPVRDCSGDPRVIRPADQALLLQAAGIPSLLSGLLGDLLVSQPDARPGPATKILGIIRATVVAETQRDILDQDTQPIYSPASVLPSRWRWLTWAAVSLVCFAVLAALLLKPFEQPAPRLLLIFPPQIVAHREGDLWPDTVRAIVDDSLRQGVLNQPRLNLASRVVGKQARMSPVELANTLGATDIVTSELDCSEINCAVTLSRLVAPDWAVANHHQWIAPHGSASGLFEIAQRQLAGLYPKLQWARHRSDLSESDYQAFTEIYSEALLEQRSTPAQFEQLKLLLARAPMLNSGYRLITEVGLNLYEQMGDAQWLAGVRGVLEDAPRSYRDSRHYAANLFAVEIEARNFEAAQQHLETSRQMHEDAVVLAEREAYLAYSRDQFGPAIQLYETQVLNRRVSVFSLYNLALAYWYQGDLENCRRRLEQILSLAKDHADSKRLLGATYLQEGDLDKAIEFFTQVLVHAETSFDLTNLSVAYLVAGEYARAVVYASKAVDKAPDSQTLLLNLADAQALSMNNEQAALLYRRVLEFSVSTDNLQSYLNRAQAAAHLGERVKAIELFNAALALAPDNTQTQFVGALVLTKAGELTSAAFYAQQAMAGNHGAVWFTLPWFEPLCASESFTKLMFESGPGFCER